MLVRSLIFAAVVAVLATQIPALFQSFEPGAASVTPMAAAVDVPLSTSSTGGYGSVRLEPDARGHYTGSFKINGKPVDGLIDTGATYVALNESTARRLGFSGNQLDFRYAVNTANGETKAAHVTLDRIEIGSIKVRGVEAFVLKDAALSGTLVGMSFLQKLASYTVADGSLSLSQ
ncbi:TIGR02281 family clan AA aspartic protease [Rhizobium sp. BK251]|uniref:TIGR02281 family clan AA aspartic protease n=1 Tax=Rhizobium sp. BK251 TaxID=2512125 RepID=UPI00104A4605|nr:TIGR02281 family clan AA aspartic protease [Rhizobium sp. BK251]TCL72000.1 aspartyl protease family protein [Rhizobium sp. BK251]